MLEYNRTPNSIETNTAQNSTEEKAVRILLSKANDENERLRLENINLREELAKCKDMLTAKRKFELVQPPYGERG